MTLLKTNKIYSVLSACIFLILSIDSKAQAPSLTATIDKPKIIIGEPLQYTVRANLPKNTYHLAWLNIPDSIGNFEVIERRKIDTLEENGALKIEQVITVTSFDSGRRTIPSFAVNFNPVNDDTAFNLLTDSIPVTVSFSPMDSSKTFHDIKSIIAVKDVWPWWSWPAVGLGLVLLLLLAYYLFKKRKKNKVPGLFTSRLSPLEEAMQALNELEKQRLLSRQQVKQFHTGLSEIFKRYISRRTNSVVHNLTTGEILLRLNEAKIIKENIGLAANNLRMADAVKFARYVPGTPESEEAFSNTKRVIEQIDAFFLKNKSDS